MRNRNHHYHKKPSFELKIAALFIITLIIAVAIFFLFKKTNSNFIDSIQRVTHTEEVLYRSAKVLSEAQDIVIGVRGYIITGDELYLEPYYKAVDTIEESVTALEELSKDNRNQQIRIDSLKTMVAKNISIRKRMIDLRRENNGVASILPLVYEARGFMTELRNVIESIQSEEFRLLDHRRKQNEKIRTESEHAIIFFISVFVLFLFTAFTIIYNNTRKRNRVESALRKSQELINSIINHAPVLINVKDRDGKYVLVNKDFATALHAVPEDMIGKSSFDFLPLATAERIALEEEMLMQTLQPTELQVKLANADGEHTYITSKFPLFDEKGRVYAIGSTSTDITPLQKAQEAIIKNFEDQQRILNGLQQVLSASSDVICLVNKSGEFVLVSDTCKGLWGYTAKDMMLKKYLDFVAEEDKVRTALIAEQVMSGQPVSEFENNYKTKDGKIIPVIWSALWSEQDNLMYCIARNGSEKKQAARQLAQSQEKLAKAQEIARLGSWEWDIRRNIFSCSKEMYHLLGVETKEDDAMVLNNAIHSDDKEKVEKAFINTRVNGLPLDIEHRIVRTDKTVLYVHTKGEAVLDNRSTTKLLNGTMLDITERKKAEEVLKQLNEDLKQRAEELKASNTELERFAYVASHDLQEPLRMVSSFLALLQRKLKDKLDDDSQKYIYFAVDGAERMKKLIQDLLQFSRLGTEKQQFEPVNLKETLENVLQNLLPAIQEAEATISLPDNLPVVKGNKMQLHQLFQNLIGNSLKYRGEENPVINVGWKENSTEWTFSIEDNGIGIDPKFFEKIFIIFQRLHNKSEYSGTGIGLAVCKRIVEKHDGKIWLTSKPGEGSTFYFTIKK